jgi:hypothetical protein
MSMKTRTATETRKFPRGGIKTRMPLAIAATVALLTTGFAQPAIAAESQLLPAEFVDEVSEVWTQYGVDEAVQDSLLLKLENGVLLDSMSESLPVNTSTIDNGDSFADVITYADGSINVLTLQKATTEVADPEERAIIGCGGGGTSNTYTNCSVSGWFTGVQLSFFASYYLNAGGNAAITAHSSPTVAACAGGLTCTPASFEVIRLTQSGSSAAQVNVVTSWAFVTIGGGGTTRLSLFVKNLSATTN